MGMRLGTGNDLRLDQTRQEELDLINRAKAGMAETEKDQATEKFKDIVAPEEEKTPEIPEEVSALLNPPAQTEQQKKLAAAITEDPNAGTSPNIENTTRGINRLGDPQLIEAIKEPSARQFYTDRLNQLQQQRDMLNTSIKEAIANAEGDREKKQLWLIAGKALEGLAQSMVQLAAANYGLRTGIDMSGLKFDRTDWQAQQEAVDKNFRARLAQLQETAAEQEKSLRSAEKEAGLQYRAQVEKGQKAERENARMLWQKQKLEWERDFEAEQKRLDRELKQKELTLKNAASLSARQVAQNKRDLKAEKLDIDKQISVLNRRQANLTKAKQMAEKDLNMAKDMLPAAMIPKSEFEKREGEAGFFTFDRTIFDEMTDEYAETYRSEIETLEDRRRQLDTLEDEFDAALIDKLSTTEVQSQSTPSQPTTEARGTPAPSSTRQGFSSAAEAIKARRGGQ